jgi:hypothetical protein
MRFSLAVAVVLMGMSVSGLAQQQKNQYKVKPSAPEKTKKAAPLPVSKASGSGTASGSNSKDLQAIEHQTAHTSAGAKGSGKKTAPALKPVKEKANPPINFNGTHAAKGPGKTNPGANSYRRQGKQR